jgi:long-chain fatty acid transport protein
MRRTAAQMTGVATLCASLTIIVCEPLRAQFNDQMNAGIQFNFSNPGARSLAMAGAFTSVADDATAAYTNPAGLTILPRKEVSLEGRLFGFSTVYTDGGRFNGTPTNMGVDTVNHLTRAAATDRTRAISFLSYVHPWRRMTIAIYRHNLANFRATFQSEGAFIESSGTLLRLFPTAGSLNLNIVNTGAAVAYKAIGGLSLGVNLSRYRGTMTGNLNRYFRGAIGTGGASVGEYFGPPRYTPDNIQNYANEHGTATQWKMSFGALWRGPRVSVGVVYRPGPSFSVFGQRRSGPADTVNPLDTYLSRPIASPFRVPDVYGAGVTVRTGETARLTFDVSRVRYSQMVRKLENIDTFSTAGELPYFRVNDGTELRIGFERVLTPAIFLRAGWWSDPDHQVRYVGTNPVDLTLWPRGHRENHYTAGAGWVLGEGDYQIDVAGDFSRRVKTVSLSTVGRF